MINEKELRTGNLYATIKNLEIIVKGIDTVNKFVVTEPIDVELETPKKNENSIIFEDLSPIELTETRISKLGLLGNEALPLAVISDNGAKFVWDPKLGQIVLMDCNSGTIGQTIRYLHQFQNLYFILTGKELPLF